MEGGPHGGPLGPPESSVPWAKAQPSDGLQTLSWWREVEGLPVRAQGAPEGAGAASPCNRPTVLGMLGEQTLQEAPNLAELWTLWPGAAGGGQVRPGLAPGGCR